MKFKLVYILILCFLSSSVLQACQSEETPTPQINASPFQYERKTYEFQGEVRDYLIHVPKSYSDSSESPLLIYLHRWHPTASRMEVDYYYIQFDPVADDNNAIIVYPSAAYNWNSGYDDDPTIVPGTIEDFDDVRAIEILIDTVSMMYSIDQNRIYAFGLENGGFMAYKLACQLSDRIAAVASVTGVMAASTRNECNPTRPVPVLVINGTINTIVPFDGTEYWPSVDETIDFWSNFNRCSEVTSTLLPDIDNSDDSMVEKIVHTNCMDNADVILYKVLNGGPWWPGALEETGKPSNETLGPTNQDIDANIEIMNFFNAHVLSP